MQRQFSVEAKSFSFSAKKGNVDLQLEEKRKGFGGFILMGTKCSGWLADVVEEVIEAQRKDGFARSFRDEVRVLKVRTGSNKAGCFLGEAVFAEGDPKGINKLPKGHGGWGWQRFMDELRSLLAQLVAKEMPEVSVINARVGGSVPSFANVLAAPLGDLKSYIVEALISMEVRFDLGSHLSWGGSIESMVALRRLAMEFLGKFRAEVDRFICFGLGFRVKASRDIRKRMGWVFSRLGLKPKRHFGCKLRGRRKPNPLVEGSRVKAGSGQGEASTEFVLASPETNRTSSAISSSNLAALEVAQSSPAMIDAGSILMGSLTSSELTQITPVGVEENPALIGSTQIVPETLLTSLEFAQIAPVGVEEIPDLIEEMPVTQLLLELGQISPKNTQTATVGVVGEKGMLRRGFLLQHSVQEAASVNLPSPELAQTVPVGTSFSPKSSSLVVFSEGSVPAPNLAVPEAQLLVHGLTEAQAWFLGWLRDGTRSHELLTVIDCVEVQMWRKNEVAPPLICSMELPKLKAALEARIQDENRETAVRGWALSVAASLEDGSPKAATGVPAVPPTAPAETGCITPPNIPIGQGKVFLFPVVLEDASTFAGLAKRSFGSKTTPRREAIQLYRITRRELEHRISTACSVYFGDKDWG
jgi:hypothetical protein